MTEELFYMDNHKDRFIFIGDIREKNGKTIKENNLEIQHKIPLGSLVEILPWERDCEWGGVRLYVVAHARDCDGTPLYCLGCKTATWHSSGGFGEDSLRVVT